MSKHGKFCGKGLVSYYCTPYEMLSIFKYLISLGKCDVLQALHFLVRVTQRIHLTSSLSTFGFFFLLWSHDFKEKRVNHINESTL